LIVNFWEFIPGEFGRKKLHHLLSSTNDNANAAVTIKTIFFFLGGGVELLLSSLNTRSPCVFSQKQDYKIFIGTYSSFEYFSHSFSQEGQKGSSGHARGFDTTIAENASGKVSLMRTPARKIEYETHNALLFIDYSAHKILKGTCFYYSQVLLIGINTCRLWMLVLSKLMRQVWELSRRMWTRHLLIRCSPSHE